jgi:DNA-binding SARP family transcriptional activator
VKLQRSFTTQLAPRDPLEPAITRSMAATSEGTTMKNNPPPERTAGVETDHSRPVLRISLFDGIALHIGDRELTLSNRKARALIAYLAVTPGMKETRDRLVGLLWSETEEAKARGSLRQLLHALRDIFDREGVAGLSTDNFHVCFDGSFIVTDLDCALASIDRGDPDEGLVRERYAADAFLRGYDDVDPGFGSWLTLKRESVRRLLIQRLEAQLSEPMLHAETTKRVAHTLFQIDPTHEIACQHLMRSYIAAGNTSGALAVYKQLWTCLEQEYDIEPSPLTKKLVVAIRSETYQLPGTGFEAANAAAVPNVEDVDSVFLLAMKLAIAWTTKLESGVRLDAPNLIRLA